jgi:hypothetical protein
VGSVAAAAVLAVDVEIGLGDGVGLQEAVVAACGASGIALLLDAAVDDEMGDVDVLRREFPGHALGEATQPELAHGEGCGERIALDAGRGAGEEDRAVAALQHQLRRCLAHQEAAVAGHHQGLLDLDGIELDEGATHAIARVVDDDIGHAEVAHDRGDAGTRVLAAAGIAGVGPRRGLFGQRRDLAGIAGGERHRHAFLGEEPRQGGAEATAGTYDEGGLAHVSLLCPLVSGSEETGVRPRGIIG